MDSPATAFSSSTACRSKVRVQQLHGVPSSSTISPQTKSNGVAEPVCAVRKRAPRSGNTRRSPHDPHGLGSARELNAVSEMFACTHPIPEWDIRSRSLSGTNRPRVIADKSVVTTATNDALSLAWFILSLRKPVSDRTASRRFYATCNKAFLPIHNCAQHLGLGNQLRVDV